GMPIELYFTEHHRWSETRYKAYRKKLLEVIEAHQIGIDFNYRTHYYNTNLVHRVLTAAELVGVHYPTHHCLLEAYHLQGINLSEIDLVRSVLINANLDAQGLLDSALHNPSVLAVMAEKVRRKAMFPVQSVPAFVFNDTDFVPGSNSKAFFKAQIETNYLGQTENVDQIATV
ncbi:MAG: DsbA family protein, partial [Pseudomonadales bacterium]|nr:DsbA family protein [Pseudomonadales bacterium]